jgi:hypothetical protein
MRRRKIKKNLGRAGEQGKWLTCESAAREGRRLWREMGVVDGRSMRP